MTIYEELLSRVEQGEKFQINFEKRNMKVGKDWLIKEGEWNKERELIGIPPAISNPFDVIEVYYNRFKTSMPSERSEAKRKGYFKALSVDELTDEQMITGQNREVAQARLEGYILIAILSGWTWQDEYGKWFWQSKTKPDLIILKQWIEGK